MNLHTQNITTLKTLIQLGDVILRLHQPWTLPLPAIDEANGCDWFWPGECWACTYLSSHVSSYLSRLICLSTITRTDFGIPAVLTQPHTWCAPRKALCTSPRISCPHHEVLSLQKYSSEYPVSTTDPTNYLITNSAEKVSPKAWIIEWCYLQKTWRAPHGATDGSKLALVET